MKLGRLKQFIDTIYNKYGDMEVEVNNISNSDIFSLSSLCVVNDNSYGDDEGTDLRLLVEIEEQDKQWQPIFKAYEYPSYEDITVS